MGKGSEEKAEARNGKEAAWFREANFGPRRSKKGSICSEKDAFQNKGKNNDL